MKSSFSKFLMAAVAACAAPAAFAAPITLNFKASILNQIDSTGQPVQDVPGQFSGSLIIGDALTPHVRERDGFSSANWSGVSGCARFVDGACADSAGANTPALLGYSFNLPFGRVTQGLSTPDDWRRTTSFEKFEVGNEQGIHAEFNERVDIFEGGAVSSEEKNLWLNLGGASGSLFTSLDTLDFTAEGAASASGMFSYTRKGCGPDWGSACGVDPASVQYLFKIDELSLGAAAADVPEPASAALLGLGFAGLVLVRRRKQQR